MPNRLFSVLGPAATALVLIGPAADAAPGASALPVGTSQSSSGRSVPRGFIATTVATVGSPTAIAETPDGRLLVTTQPGQVRVIDHGTLVSAPAIDLASKLCSDFERGLLGIAVDPGFPTRPYVYLDYTFAAHGPACEHDTPNAPVNRISRFTVTANTIDAGSEVVLVDVMPSPNGNHNGGMVAFGPDGNLWGSIGDGGCDYAGDSGCGADNDAARDLNTLTGKIVRVTPDGGVPSGNPYSGAGSVRCNRGGGPSGTRCQEIWATGLRNPFRFAFDRSSSSLRLFINDVGQDTWEEIDEGAAGADYGWNRREGTCDTGSTTRCGSPPPGLTDPVLTWGHGDGCTTITGGAFAPASWPSRYRKAYLVGDFSCGQIFAVVKRGSRWRRTSFASGLGYGSPTSLLFGTTSADAGTLYYTTYADGGAVRAIRPAP